MTDSGASLHRRQERLLRWRVWLRDRVQPTEWQGTLLWAAAAGTLGGLTSTMFTAFTEGIHGWFGGRSLGIVDAIAQLPSWGRVLVPAVGAALAGIVLAVGRRFARSEGSADYMEAIAIGTGRIGVRTSLVQSTAAVFAIGSGSSIGREGPMVQLAAVAASLLGRWRRFSPPQLRLLVACGAAAGIAAAYHAPIAGAFFVAEVILGAIATESFGPLVVAAVAATLTIRFVSNATVLYQVPAFRMASAWEMGPYLLLGFAMGALAPPFLASLKGAERFFAALSLPLVLRIALGGLVVGVLAIFVPEVCGNGYTVIVEMLNGRWAWAAIAGIFACKWLATMASFGSGAPGGVFTPSLFMGAGAGLLFGAAVHAVLPMAAPYPWAFALVGMGAFLSAATHAPVMAVIMLLEMTSGYDIILPLMLCSVIAYYTAKSLDGASLYGDVLARRAAQEPAPAMGNSRVSDLMRGNPPTIRPDAPFGEVARMFLDVRVNNIYMVDADGRFIGVVSLHDIKPYLADPGLSNVVLARDIAHEDFPRLAPDQLIAESLQAFAGVAAERLPVVGRDGRLLGSLSKSDLLLSLSEARKRHP